MGRKWWRSWPVVAVVAAGLAVLGVHLTVAWLNREQPNYSQIEDGLYLGGFVREPPPHAKAVLNLCETEDPYLLAAHRWEPIPDTEPAPTLDWLREQVRFIEAQREAGRAVFVHCRNGVSRSGMVVVAYLMARNDWSRDEALTFVRSRRDIVRPNPAFMRLLQEWEQSMK
jgi:protein-tyrosine phosphatase